MNMYIHICVIYIYIYTCGAARVTKNIHVARAVDCRKFSKVSATAIFNGSFGSEQTFEK